MKLQEEQLKVVICLLLAIFCSLCSSVPALSFEMRVPLKCSIGVSCGTDVDAVDIRPIDPKIKNCKSQPHHAACDIVLTDIEDLCPTPEQNTEWASVELIKNGNTRLTWLQNAYKAGTVLGFGGNRYVIVQSSDSPGGEQHFAACAVEYVGSKAGPPMNCFTLAVITRARTLLRVSYKGGMCSFAFTERPGTGVIDINFDVLTNMAVDVVAARVSEMLEHRLDMAVGAQKYLARDGTVSAVNIKATSAIRNTLILRPGWRESFFFDFSIGRDGDIVKVHGTSQPMVCLTASGDVADLHPPDAIQQAQYASKFDALVREALSKNCDADDGLRSEDRITCK